MATSAEIGATGSSYTGDPGLGGYGLGFGRIDTRPLQDLARYTYFYNQAEWMQRQKDAEAQAKELSDSLSYDLTSSIPKDSQILRDKYKALTDYLGSNPDAANFKNTDKWIKFKTMKNDIVNDIRSASVRHIMNLARQEEIDNTTSPELKQYLQEQLSKEIDATDIRTPLRHTAKYDIAPVPVTAAPLRKFSVTDVGRNVIGTAEWNMIDQAALNNMANTLASGLANLGDIQNSEQFKNAPPPVQAKLLEQQKSQLASGKLEPVLSAQYFNSALKSLGDNILTTLPNGQKSVDLNALVNSSNPLVRGIAQQVAAYNNEMDQMTKYIKAGYFRDNFGNELHFGNDASGLNENDYRKIDLTNGLQPEELLKMQIYGKSQQTPNREIKLLQTDNEIQKARIAQEWERLGLDKAQFNYKKSGDIVGADSVLREVSDVINSGQRFIRTHKDGRTGKTTTENVLQIADPNLIKEFATIDKEGKEINRPDVVVYNPRTNGLTLTYYKRPDMEKVFVNGNWTGEYQVVDSQKDNVGPDGYLRDKKGNILIADEKPLNARQWMGQVVGRKFSADDKGKVNNLVDQVYSKFGNLQTLAQQYLGGETQQGATSESASASLSTNPSDWKKVGNYWQYKDGTLYDANGNVIKK